MTQADPVSLTSVVAQRVKELRRARGWTAQRLGEEVGRLGVPFDRNVVANLESGRRQAISIEEMFALAYTFGVAPVDLLIPASLLDEPFPVTPAVSAPTSVAREWFRGDYPLVRPVTPAALAAFIAVMPPERAQVVSREWWEREDVGRQLDEAKEEGDQ